MNLQHRHFIIKGYKNNQVIDIAISQLLMGSADYLRADNMELAKPMLDAFFAHGGNIIDTARHYRHAEKAIARWIALRDGKRDDIVLFTKGCHPVREAPDKPRLNAACIHEDIQTSLQMLETDHVELFALHRDDPNISVAEIMTELNRQIDLGTVYAVGVSNWSLERIIAAQEYALKNGLKALSFTSPNLSLARPMRPRWPNCVSADAAMIAWHKANNMPLLSWSSQAGGFFSGRFTKEDRSDQEMVECFYNVENWEKYERCKILANDKHKTPIQIALAYVLNQDFKTAAAIGPESMDEMMVSIEAEKISLSQEEIEYLELISIKSIKRSD